MARQVEGFSRLHLNSWQAEAALSSCGAYRWLLHRPIQSSDQISKQRRVLLFVGLNPSRADGHRDDPTLRRLQGFAHQWGYHHLVVLNLFARISPSPSLLCRCAEPIGAENDLILHSWFQQWAQQPKWDLWLGWGVGGGLRQRCRGLKNVERRQRSTRSAFTPLRDWLDQSGLSTPPPLPSI